MFLPPISGVMVFLSGGVIIRYLLIADHPKKKPSEEGFVFTGQ